MARRIFFSFHYQDVIDFRANVVRQHWLTKPDRESAGFFDASIWETAKKAGSVAVKRLINSGLKGTTTTCVLAGSQTYARKWVRYEIMKSFRKGNSLLTVHINAIKGKDGLTKTKGPNPFSYLGVTYSENGQTATLYEGINGTWRKYAEIDGSASYQTSGVGRQHWGKGYNFAQWYHSYDWVEQNGYENFSRWIG